MATEKQKTCKRCFKPKEGDNSCNCGRPTKYEERFIDEVDKYLAENQDEERQLVKSSSSQGYEAFENKLTVKLPTIEGFALFIGVPKRTIYDWRDNYKEFSHSLEKIVLEQQKRLINMGLSVEYNSTIAKLILSSNHGMRERTDFTSDDKALPTPILDPLNKKNVHNNNSDSQDSEDEEEN